MTRLPAAHIACLTATLAGATAAQDWCFAPSVGNTGSDPTITLLEDLDGDGVLDLVTANGGAGNVSVHLGQGDRTFGSRSDYATSPAPWDVAAGDFDEDGHLDLVVGHDALSVISLLRGVGDGTFVTATFPPVAAALQPGGDLAVTDLDLDGDLDIAIGGGAVASTIVALYPNNGDGTFAAPVQQQLPVALPSAPSAQGAYGVSAGDLDGDGRPDLVVSHLGSSPPGVNLSILGNLAADACAPWTYVDAGEPGSFGMPWLVGTGTLDAGSPYAISLFRAAPASTSLLVFGATALLAPFKGGTLVPDPLVVIPLTVAGDGTIALAGTLPSGGPSGLDFFVQHWIQDAGGVFGFAGSNGLRAAVP